MDGKGRCLDNIWIERLWRTIKQEYIYLNPAEDGKVLFKGLRKFLDYYNNRRSHRSLDRKTPFDWYEYAAQKMRKEKGCLGLKPYIWQPDL